MTHVMAEHGYTIVKTLTARAFPRSYGGGAENATNATGGNRPEKSGIVCLRVQRTQYLAGGCEDLRSGDRRE